MPRLRYPKEILESVMAHARAAYPAECCGVISGAEGRHGPELVAVHEMQNVYDRYHEVDPEAYPRTSRTAYLMDPQKQARLMDALDEAGTPVRCIYHSHVDVGAYFSEEDQRMALLDGEPLYPDVEYLVVDVQKGEAVRAEAFAWDGGAFTGREAGGREG